MHKRDYFMLIFALICLCFCITYYQQTVSAVSANTITVDGLIYTENEDGTLTVTGFDDSNPEALANLEIYNMVGEKTVTAIADRVFQNQTFETVFIDNGIYIGDYAFENASFSQSVTIGNDNTGTVQIGEFAFASAAFDTLIFNANVSIDDYAFYKSGLHEVVQTDSFTTYIGKNAFEKSAYESGINFSKLTYIGPAAFSFCLGMKSFTISSTLEAPELPFLPNDIYTDYLGDYLHVYIDDDVTDISNYNLGWNYITVYHVSPGSPLISYLSKNNYLFCINETGNPEDVYGKPLPHQIIFGDNYTIHVDSYNVGYPYATLTQYKFDGTSLSLADISKVSYHGYSITVNRIQNTALQEPNCPYVSEVIYGNNIQQIATGTFLNNTNIKKIVLSDTISEIQPDAFDNRNNLTLEVPAGITDISIFHFENLDRIVFLIPRNSILLQGLVDRDMTIQFPGGAPVTPDSPEYPAKSNTGSGDNPVTPPTTEAPTTETPTTETPTTETPTVEIPTTEATVDPITPSDPLPPITPEDELPPLAPTGPVPPKRGTIISVKQMKYLITGGNTVTFLKPINKKITKLNIPATITYKSFTFKVTKIGEKACYKCTKLRTVIINDNVATIGDSAFAECSRLKSITFGKNVRKLGKKVLYNNKKLEKIKFLGTELIAIGKQTFRKVPKTVSILVPRAKVKKYKRLINNAK